MKQPCFMGVLLLLFILFFPFPSLPNSEVFPKSYRGFVVKYGAEEGNMTTKVLPEDKDLIVALKNIRRSKIFDASTEAEVMAILKKTDAGLVVEYSLRLLRFFSTLSPWVIKELNSLAEVDDEGIKKELAWTLIRFRYPATMYGMIFCVTDNHHHVKSEAILGLSYFGIEAISAFPFIKSEEFGMYHGLYLSKVLYHIFAIGFSGGGMQLVPSPTSALVILPFHPGYPTSHRIIYLPPHQKYSKPIFPLDQPLY